MAKRHDSGSNAAHQDRRPLHDEGTSPEAADDIQGRVDEGDEFDDDDEAEEIDEDDETDEGSF